MKPGIGSISDWRKHEARNNYLKQKIGGSFLLNKKQTKIKRFGDMGLAFLDQSQQDGQHMLNVKLPKLSSSTEHVDIPQQPRGQSHTAQLQKR